MFFMDRHSKLVFMAGYCALAAGLLASVPSRAQSFDCSEARRPDEKAICENTDLSARDEIVSTAFNEAKKASGRKTAIAATRKLLDERHRCGGDVECINRNQDTALQVYQALGATATWASATGSELQAGNAGSNIGSGDATYVDLDVPVQNEKLRLDEETFMFNVCNKAKTDLTLALSGRSAPKSAEFVAIGWAPIKKGQCANLGPFMKGDFFWAASGPKGTWGKGVQLCVERQSFKRTYSQGERQKCGKGYTMGFTHLFAQRDTERLTLK